MGKRYSPKLKFQVVTELLGGDKTAARIAKAYGIHANTINARDERPAVIVVHNPKLIRQGRASDGSIAASVIHINYATTAGQTQLGAAN